MLLLLPWQFNTIVPVESHSILPAGYLDVDELAIQLRPVLIKYLKHSRCAGMSIEVCILATLVSSTPLISC